jgi:hypothetical protein
VAFGEPKAAEMQLPAAPVPDETVEERRYRITDLSGFRADPDQFFEFGYRDTLRGMIEAVIEAESPLRADILAQRLSRAHGWLRTGGRIRERIDLHLRGLDTTQESSGEFIWKKGAISLDEPDPARDLARLLGVERLAAVSRSRLDEAIARARQHDSTTQPFG